MVQLCTMLKMLTSLLILLLVAYSPNHCSGKAAPEEEKVVEAHGQIVAPGHKKSDEIPPGSGGTPFEEMLKRRGIVTNL